MEFFNARPDLPLDTCLQGVRQSDVMVVVVAHRYGSIAPGTNMSFSEAEYHEVFNLKKEILVYFRDDSARVLAKHIEVDAQSRDRLMKWKELLCARHTVGRFRSSQDLALKVAGSLMETVARLRPGEAPAKPSAPTPSLLSVSDVEDYVHEALEKFGSDLVNDDEQVTSLIAGTNASGY